MIKITVFAGQPIELSALEAGAHHYNVTEAQAKKFAIRVYRDPQSPIHDPQIAKVTFTKDGANHTEMVRPFMSNGDRDYAADDAPNPPLWIINETDGVKVPHLIALNKGVSKYKIEILFDNGAKNLIDVQINVGEVNWLIPPADDPPADEVDDRLYPLLLPIDVWITRDDRVRGIPLAKVDEFVEKIKAIFNEYEHIPPVADDAGEP